MSKKNRKKNATVAPTYLTVTPKVEPLLTESQYPYDTAICHIGPKQIMKIGSATIYAGDKEEIESWPWALRVNLLGYGSSPKIIKFENGAAELFPSDLNKALLSPTIVCDWIDRAAPPWPIKLWEQIIESFGAINGNIGIHCQGGHGRTGTMIAILAGLTGQLKKDECPVLWARKHHCKKAVETNSQLNYIEEITNCKVEANASDTYSKAIGFKGGAHYSSNAAVGNETGTKPSNAASIATIFPRDPNPDQDYGSDLEEDDMMKNSPGDPRGWFDRALGCFRWNDGSFSDSI